MKKFLASALCLLVTHPVFANCTLYPDHMECSGGYYEQTQPVFDYKQKLVQIFTLALLTGIIETFVFWCFKYRGVKKLLYIFIINLISNCLMNLLNLTISRSDLWFWLVKLTDSIYSWLLLLETGAILFEFLLFGKVFKYSKKLLGIIILANIISYLIGLFIYYYLSKYISYL